MKLKDMWKDKIDDVDDIISDDINNIAHAVIELEKNAENTPNVTKEYVDGKILELNNDFNNYKEEVSEVTGYLGSELTNLNNEMIILEDEFNKKIGDIESALDELHNYAQALINGGAE